MKIAQTFQVVTDRPFVLAAQVDAAALVNAKAQVYVDFWDNVGKVVGYAEAEQQAPGNDSCF